LILSWLVSKSLFGVSSGVNFVHFLPAQKMQPDQIGPLNGSYQLTKQLMIIV